MAHESWAIVLTCEHGGNKVPIKCERYLCDYDKSLLNSHRGWDIGALKIAKNLNKKLASRLFFSENTRLLVDLNRSANRCIGPYLQHLDSHLKAQLIDILYYPYRNEVTSYIEFLQHSGSKIFHISIHSFTPELDGKVRNVDLAFLYDPSRQLETKIVKLLIESTKSIKPSLRCRRNYPYRGTADGFTTSLRRRFEEDIYVGIEVEINQNYLVTRESILEFSELLAANIRNVVST